MQDGIVSRSQRYIASGSAPRAPSGKATVGEVLRPADPQTLQIGLFRQLDGLRQLDGRRVALVAPGDERVEVGAVADRLRDRTDLVEARGKGDDPVARYGAVRRPEADVAAERRRLLDRAARVGAERPWREAAADGRG